VQSLPRRTRRRREIGAGSRHGVLRMPSPLTKRRR
jgi:hypothetical protein